MFVVPSEFSQAFGALGRAFGDTGPLAGGPGQAAAGDAAAGGASENGGTDSSGDARAIGSGDAPADGPDATDNPS